MLGLHVNTLAADEKYSVLNRDYLTIAIKMELFQKQKFFLELLLHFWNLNWILNILNKNMTLIDFVFSKLSTLKT